MKQLTSRGTFFVYALLVIFFVVCIGWLIHNWMFNGLEYQLNLDPAIAPEIQKEIRERVRKGSEYQAARLIETLQENIDYIQSTHLVYLPNHTVDIEVTSHLPGYIINNNYVLTDKNRLVPKQWYTAEYLENRPSIMIDECAYDYPIISSDLLYTLHNLPLLFYDNYTFVWKNKVDSWLFDKEDPLLAIRFNSAKIPSLQLIHICKNIKKEILEQARDKKKKGRFIVADLRFANQVIVYEKKGGWGNGTDIT